MLEKKQGSASLSNFNIIVPTGNQSICFNIIKLFSTFHSKIKTQSPYRKKEEENCLLIFGFYFHRHKLFIEKETNEE